MVLKNRQSGNFRHFPSTKNLKVAATKIVMIAGFFIQCVFVGPYNDEPLSMQSLDAHGDTLSVFPKLRFAFSPPLSDSSVALAFSPSIGRYGAFLNPTRDTLVVDVMDMLEGNTRYVVRLSQTVFSTNESSLDPSSDSTVFYTFPCEQENNDEPELADTLSTVMFGTLSDGSDIDVFTLNQEHCRGVFLESLNSRDSFFLTDSKSHGFGVPRAMTQNDTLFIPDAAQPPYYVFVESGIKGFEGPYKIGVIP
jgi:hypothetical protein